MANINTIPMETKIKHLTNRIAEGEITPAEAGVGKLLNKLRLHNEAAYCDLLAAYAKVMKSKKVKRTIG